MVQARGVLFLAVEPPFLEAGFLTFAAEMLAGGE